MNEMQILGGLLGCGVVSAVALGIIALNVSKGVAVLSQWTVEKDSTEEAISDVVLAEVRKAKSANQPIQIGIKR